MENYNEIWKQINNHKNYYVSNFGRVKNITNERILKGTIMQVGYYVIQLDGKKYCIHRLVAEAFIQNPLNKKYVDHKDLNKLNNKIDF